MTFLRRCAIAFLALSSPASSSDFPVRVTNANGTTVSISAPPRRVVGVGQGAFGQLILLGVRPVGLAFIHDWSDYLAPIFPNGANITTIGDNPLDLETIAMLEPDLIFGDVIGVRAAVNQIAPVWETRAWSPEFESIADVEEQFLQLGMVMGMAGRAQSIIDVLEAKLASLRVPDHEKRTVLLTSSINGQFWSLTQASATCRVIAVFATCKAPETDESRVTSRSVFFASSIEKVYELDPDVILLMNAPDDSQGGSIIPETIAGRPAETLWRRLKAFRNGRIVPMRGSNAIQSLASVFDIADRMPHAIYPDRFAAGSGPAGWGVR